MEKPQKFDPYLDLSPPEYMGFLASITENHLLLWYSIFSGFPTNRSCILVTGSDGKGERHPQSNTNFIVLHDGSQEAIGDLALLRRFVKDDVGLTDEKIGTSPIASCYEEKVLGEPDHHPLSFAYGNPNTAYPDRVLNAVVIGGNQDLYLQARQQLLEEICKNSPVAKKTRRQMSEQLRRYKKAIITGIYDRLPLFDERRGIQFYCEENGSLQMGFKSAFLRAVQRKLDIITIRAVHKGVVTIKEIVYDAPFFTPDRISFFTNKNIIGSQQAEQIIEAYIWFLQQYHRIQELYKNTKQKKAAPYDRELFDYYRKAIWEFTNIPL
jgi:hypothetical protein